MIEIKKWLPLTFDSGGKAEEDSKVICDATAGILKEPLSLHKLLEMTFTPQSSTDTWALMCVLPCLCASVCLLTF